MGNLTTTANLRTYLGPEIGAPSGVGSYSDPFLAAVITAVSGQVEKWLSRTIASANYADSFSGPGGIFVLTRQWPIIAVSGVSVGGSAIPPSLTQTDFGYQFDNRKVHLRGYRFCRGVMNCSIDYTAGYATTPPDIEAAVWEACAAFLATQQRDPEATMQRAGDTQQQFQVNVPGAVIFTKSVTSALMPYRPTGFSY